MIDIVSKLAGLNQQIESLLLEDEVDWASTIELIEQRDQVVKEHAETANVDKSELKSLLQKSLELNKCIATRMKAEKQEVETALLTLNQGKKARASYE